MYALKDAFQSTIGRQFTAEQLNQWQKQKKHDTVALFETEIRKIAAGSSAKWAQDLNKFTEVSVQQETLSYCVEKQIINED